MQHSVIKSTAANLGKSTFQNKVIPVIFLLIHSHIGSDKDSSLPLAFLCQSVSMCTFDLCGLFHLSENSFKFSSFKGRRICIFLLTINFPSEQVPRFGLLQAGATQVCSLIVWVPFTLWAGGDVEMKWRDWLFLTYFSLSLSIGSLWTGSSSVELQRQNHGKKWRKEETESSILLFIRLKTVSAVIWALG